MCNLLSIKASYGNIGQLLTTYHYGYTYISVSINAPIFNLMKTAYYDPEGLEAARRIETALRDSEHTLKNAKAGFVQKKGSDGMVEFKDKGEYVPIVMLPPTLNKHFSDVWGHIIGDGFLLGCFMVRF